MVRGHLLVQLLLALFVLNAAFAEGSEPRSNQTCPTEIATEADDALLMQLRHRDMAQLVKHEVACDCQAVYGFWDKVNHQHTFHFPPAWKNEDQDTIQFYAYRGRCRGMEPVYDFWDNQNKEHTFHLDSPWRNEIKGSVQYYVSRGPKPGMQAVYVFWDRVNKQHTFHFGKRWANEIKDTIQFYAFPELPCQAPTPAPTTPEPVSQLTPEPTPTTPEPVPQPTPEPTPEQLFDPSVVATNAEYTFFDNDIQHYNASFGPYLPALTEQDTADDLVLFLPVSYHMNPANFQDLMTKKYYIEEDDGWKAKDVCSASDLDYYKDGPTPEYKFCGFAGRKVNYDCDDEDPNCKDWCFADVREAFGPVDRADLFDPPSQVQVSFYFTWYSKEHNQPLLTGFWTNPFLSYEPSRCSAASGLCDPTCADSGGPLKGTLQKGDAFQGCNAERACGKFATCALGSAVISQDWMDERPRQYDGNQSACEAQGYYYRKSDGFCKYDSYDLGCDTGRCFDRGHLVPSGVAGWHYGRSGQTFSMCNIGAQTAYLNECKWQWLEKVLACAGQYHSMLIFGGAMGPFKPSNRMTNITQPAAFFKVVFLPRQNGLPGDTGVKDTAFVWIFANNEERAYQEASYRGQEGLEAIQAQLGLRFPPAVQAADFPEDCSMFSTLLADGRMDACGISRDGDSSGSAGPFYLLETCAGKTGLTVPQCPYFPDL